MSDAADMDHLIEYYRRMMRQSQQSANPDMDKVMECMHHVFQPDPGRDIDWYGSGHWDPETLVYHTKRVFTVLNSLSESSDDNADWDKDIDKIVVEDVKVKEKAEKKRLKKKRQKERKRLEKQQKEKPNNTQDDKEDKTTQVCNVNKEYLNLREMATALESDSSNNASDESGDDEEGLDLTSSFVTKAAEIAKRKLAQKQETKDKKKSPVKDEPKTPEKSPEKHEIDKDTVDTGTDPSSPKMEDFVKMSAEFASIGNKYAGAGDYETAVRFFTDAIKYNPIEYRLFGNRAFCFERLQEYEKALGDAELSLSMCPGWSRGLFRKGRALAGLKRYEEAAGAFQEILKLSGSYPEAAQELMNVQISQLMESGFSWEQSSKALVVHGSVEKAREALSNKPQVSSAAPVPVRQVANVNGVSPVLSAKAAAASAAPPPLHLPLPPPALGASKTLPPKKEPLIHVQEPPSQAKPEPPAASKSGHVVQAPELFPVWVGNLSVSVTEELLRNIFNKVGTVYSVKVLPAKRCAFINYTQQQQCDVAIRRYHGFELMGSKLAVRYPDRIPPGLNISKAAYKADDLHDPHLRYNLYAAGRNARPYHNYWDPHKY